MMFTLFVLALCLLGILFTATSSIKSKEEVAEVKTELREVKKFNQNLLVQLNDTHTRLMQMDKRIERLESIIHRYDHERFVSIQEPATQGKEVIRQ